MGADRDQWVSGVLHVHTEYSDGAGSLDEIAEAAAAAGLDFVVLTDHWSLDALEDQEEGYRNGVLMLVGVEATTELGHVLGLDLPATPLRFARTNADETLGQIRELGGFAIVAHPDARERALGWSGWNERGYQGLELFNAYSAYSRQGLADSVAYLFLRSFFQGALFDWTLDFDDELVRTWDRLLQGRKMAAWTGADAHGGLELTERYFLKWPSYAFVFRMSRNYLNLTEPLTGNPDRDRGLVYDALRQGRGFVALNAHPAGAAFRFWAERDGRRWPMGSDIDMTTEARIVLRASAPDTAARLSLFRDGNLVATSDGKDLSVLADGPGVYRVEARRRMSGMSGSRLEPWLVSNPIALLEATEIESRTSANGAPPSSTEWIDSSAIRYPIRFYADVNEECDGIDLEPDAFGAGSFRVRFRLGLVPRGEPDLENAPYGRCTVANRDIRDLTGYEGLRFEVRGDEIYRVSFFLADRVQSDRTANIWTTSFLTRREWQTVEIPFSVLLGSQSGDPGVDFSDVSEISFFFDTANTRPGTEGEVEVRNFSVVPVR